MAVAMLMVLSPPEALAKEKKGAKAAKSEAKEVVDLNNASQRELEALPGIGCQEDHRRPSLSVGG